MTQFLSNLEKMEHVIIISDDEEMDDQVPEINANVGIQPLEIANVLPVEIVNVPPVEIVNAPEIGGEIVLGAGDDDDDDETPELEFGNNSYELQFENRKWSSTRVNRL